MNSGMGIIISIVLLVYAFLTKFRVLFEASKRQKDLQKELDNKTLLDCSLDSSILVKLNEIRKKHENGIPLMSELDEILNPEDVVNTPNLDVVTIMRSAPSIFVGLGVFGTFLGLSFGLLGLDLVGSKAIEEGIPNLLGNTGTAFITSVVGMFLSLLYGWLSERLFNRINSTYHILITICEKEQMVGIWDRNEGRSLRIGEFYSKMLESSYEMQMKIDGLAEQVSEKVGTIIADQMEAYQGKLVNTFQGGLGEAAKRGAQSARETFEDLIANMVAVTGEVKNTMSDLTSGMSTNIQSLDTLMTKIESAVSAFDAQVNSVDSTLENLGLIDKSFENTISILSSTSNSLIDAISHNKNATSQFIENWEETNNQLGNLNKDYKVIYQNMSDSGKEIGKILDNASKNIGIYHKDISSTTIAQLKEYHDAISNFSGRLSDAANDLQSAVENNPISQSANEIKLALDQMASSIREMSKQAREAMNLTRNSVLIKTEENV